MDNQTITYLASASIPALLLSSAVYGAVKSYRDNIKIIKEDAESERENSKGLNFKIR